MERTCGKCKGQGGFARRRSTSLSQLVSGDSGWVKCNVCGGSGVNPNYREKSCERCGRSIGYHKDANYPPKYCSSCKSTVQAEKQAKQHERERQNAMWREKACPGLRGQGYCGKTIKYRIDWDKVPDICPECRAKAKAQKAQRDAEWREKPCATSGCHNVVKYNINWDKPPNLCNECKEKRKADKDKWQEKPCATPGCANKVKYRTDWDHPPNFCASCKENQKRRKEHQEPVPGFHRKDWTNQRGDVGKVLSNEDEPNRETHLHRHPDGTTISTYERDSDGKMKPTGRYNFDTGEDETPNR